MKFKKLAVASAMAVAALSGQAMAAAPGIATTPDVDVYLTGASAPQNILGALAETMFGANTAGTFNNYHVFYDNGSTIGASYRAYYGALQSPITVNSPTVGSVTLAAGTKVRLVNRAKGGSVWGVDPVARTQNIAWMNPSSSNCTLQTNTSLAYQYLCAESGSDTNAADVNNRVSDFGVSDVEPAMFKATLNVEGNAGELTPTELATLTSTAANGLLFGIPATTSVPAGINFTRGLYSSLLSGLTQDWTSIDSSLTGKTQVVICRRVQGSGTQTTYNAYFNNFPCTANSLVPGVAAPSRMGDSAGYSETASTITVNPDAGFTVIENPSSGNVRSCLEKAQTGGAHTFSYLTDAGVTKTVTVNFAAGGGYRAVGILSLDSTPTANWGFRNLNGQAPTKTNLRNGNYDFFGEQSMQYNNTGHNNYYPIASLNDTTNWVVTAVNSGSATHVKNKRAFIEEFIRRAGDPAILNQITSTALKNATAALPLAYVPDEVTADGLNTMYVTHQGNACSPVVRYPYPGL
ncbi:MAG: hypothetical protein ACYC1T_01950 [Sulfuricaulis sp.]